METVSKKGRRSIAVDTETSQWYNKLSEESGFSAHFLMRQALSWFIKHINDNPKRREAICVLYNGGEHG